MLDGYKVTRNELSEYNENYAMQIARLIGAKYLVKDTGAVITITVPKK